ncbi:MULTISPECIES: Gfo/Idh/MocA family protein [Nocardioides]|uniref:Gfo/Idh/MocA family protein n=1 Tax=Nocardioides vastitatis TaxID=2568655 RepID=A0ABW0ZJ85_9ACTN|nr:Gfo/Idh/MocA family oxidoreductase [Nocardioides sp.]
MGGRRRVLLVGLGTIARTHREALAADASIEIVGGVDPSPAQQDVVPLFRDLDQAFAAGVDPDLVVVATPTRTHLDIVSDVLDRCDALILSEKPLATSVSGIRQLERSHGRDRVASRVRVAHHFAFSPDVEWARAVVQQNPGWGKPSHILCVFNDAYSGLSEEQRASYVSSWVDSGPNQLSVAAAFATGWHVVAHSEEGDRAMTTLDHDGGVTVLASNWLAADTSKQTAIRFDHVGVEVRVDHTSMTALVLSSGRPVEHLGYTGSAGRKAAQYLGLYRALRDDPADHRLSVDLAASIAGLLEGAAHRSAEVLGSWASTAEVQTASALSRG